MAISWRDKEDSCTYGYRVGYLFEQQGKRVQFQVAGAWDLIRHHNNIGGSIQRPAA